MSAFDPGFPEQETARVMHLIRHDALFCGNGPPPGGDTPWLRIEHLSPIESPITDNDFLEDGPYTVEKLLLEVGQADHLLADVLVDHPGYLPADSESLRENILQAFLADPEAMRQILACLDPPRPPRSSERY